MSEARFSSSLLKKPRMPILCGVVRVGLCLGIGVSVVELDCGFLFAGVNRELPCKKCSSCSVDGGLRKLFHMLAARC